MRSLHTAKVEVLGHVRYMSGKQLLAGVPTPIGSRPVTGSQHRNFGEGEQRGWRHGLGVEPSCHGWLPSEAASCSLGTNVAASHLKLHRPC